MGEIGEIREMREIGEIREIATNLGRGGTKTKTKYSFTI
jgi:hypothetical protein